MKTIKTLFLLIAMLFSSSSLFAHDFVVDGIYYNITSSTRMTVEVTYKGIYSDSYEDEYYGSVSIPGNVTYEGSVYRVTRIGKSAFNDCSRLTSVVIGNSVASIGDYAFFYCSRLTSVVIGNSVTSIGDYAFYCCDGLTSLTIGSAVESIGEEAFGNCQDLEKVYAMSSKAVKCNKYIFSSIVYDNAVLYVPEGSISSYENTAPWWFFYNISPIPTAIEDVEMDAEDRNAPVYNLQGMKMQDAENLPKGIYVKNGKKFLVK